jgi:hypothetical protein
MVCEWAGGEVGQLPPQKQKQKQKRMWMWKLMLMHQPRLGCSGALGLSGASRLSMDRSRRRPIR